MKHTTISGTAKAGNCTGVVVSILRIQPLSQSYCGFVQRLAPNCNPMIVLGAALAERTHPAWRGDFFLRRAKFLSQSQSSF